MSGSTASKKVARAARTGGGRRRNFNSNLGYYGLLLGLAALGVALVVFSRNERLTEVNGGAPPRSQEAADGGDRWYSAYGFYICDKFVAPINSPADNLGFSTQNDGIIYIHPVERAYSGSNANVGAFAQEVGLKIDRDSFQLPADSVEYVDGETKCGDKTGKLAVKVWSDAKKPDGGEVRGGDPNRILLKNNQAITFAFVPEDFDADTLPLPPSVPALDAAPAKDAAAQQSAAAGGGVPTAPAAGDTPIDPAAGATPAPSAPAAP